MGEAKVKIVRDQKQMQHFVRQLLSDVEALEFMLDNDWFESDIMRIGAEQEMCIVDKDTFIFSSTSILMQAGLNVSLSTMHISCSAPIRMMSLSNQSLSSINSKASTSLKSWRTKCCICFWSRTILTLASPIRLYYF